MSSEPTPKRLKRDDTPRAPLRAADLFCGIGGFHLAMNAIQASVVFASEIDQHAVKTYTANHGMKPSGDITKIHVDDIPDIDILCGGFPCQSFSSIGKREGFESKTKGGLFFEIMRIVDAKKPRVLLLENVKGLLSHDGGKTLTTILERLGEHYTVYHRVLNSADYSVPQKRERIYFVCFRSDLPHAPFVWPTPTGRVGIGPYLEQHDTGYGITKYLQQTYLHKKDDGRPRIVDHQSTQPVNTLAATYHKIQRLTGTFVRDGDTGLRLFSRVECLRLQGFPDDFALPVSRTQVYRQLGNSVSVPVVTAIAKAIVASLR